MPYDRESGVAYSETIITKQQATCTCDTVHSAAGIPPRLGARHRHGTRSMQATLTRALLRNRALLTPSSLLTAPDRLTDRLWSALVQSALVSVHVWQIFAARNHPGIDRVKRWRWGCRACLPTILPRNLAAADSASGAWLTDLNLGQDPDISEAELAISIPPLHNLRRLSLCTRNFSDRVLRAWAEAAAAAAAASPEPHKGAFGRLEALLVEWPVRRPGPRAPPDDANPPKLSQWSPTYLRHFPRLEIYALRGYGLGEKSGTQPATRVQNFVCRA